MPQLLFKRRFEEDCGRGRRYRSESGICQTLRLAGGPRPRLVHPLYRGKLARQRLCSPCKGNVAVAVFSLKNDS